MIARLLDTSALDEAHYSPTISWLDGSDCAVVPILRHNFVVVAMLLAGRFTAGLATVLTLTINGAIVGIVYGPVVMRGNYLTQTPTLVYGLVESSAYVHIAAVSLSMLYVVNKPYHSISIVVLAHISFGIALLWFGAILESLSCP